MAKEIFLEGKEAAELFGTTAGYVKKLYQRREIKGKKVKRSTGGTGKLLYSLSSLVARYGVPEKYPAEYKEFFEKMHKTLESENEEPEPEPEPKPVIKTKTKPKPIEVEPEEISAPKRIANATAPKTKAEIAYKREQIRKLKIENDKKEGNLIDIDDFASDIADIFQILFDEQRNYIDSMSIEHQLSSSIVKNMQKKFDVTLEGSKAKVLALVKK